MKEIEFGIPSHPLLTANTELQIGFPTSSSVGTCLPNRQSPPFPRPDFLSQKDAPLPLARKEKPLALPLLHPQLHAHAKAPSSPFRNRQPITARLRVINRRGRTVRLVPSATFTISQSRSGQTPTGRVRDR